MLRHIAVYIHTQID